MTRSANKLTEYTIMIDAVFIQSCTKELKSGRLLNFLSQPAIQSINIPKILFLDNNFNNDVSGNLLFDFIKSNNLKIEIVSVVDNFALNKTSYTFQFLINYKAKEFKKILLLETDCSLKPGFIKKIMRDMRNIKNHDWFLYGSYYYGQMSIAFKDHINGVAIYNRNKNFLNLINKALIEAANYKNNENYDFILHKAIYSQFGLSKYIDSQYIVNISPDCDINLNYKKIKPKSVIIHQKKF